MNNKNKKNAPKLDLSFAYGSGIMKLLTDQDIRAIESQQEAASNDDTVRTITSLYTGCRPISGLEKKIDVDMAGKKIKD